MKKALFILVLVVVVGVIVWVIMSPAPQPVWQPKTQVIFLGFTNQAMGAPATNAWFGINDLPPGSVGWRVAEISHQERGRWKRWEPLPVPGLTLHPQGLADSGITTLIPVPTTNGPLRVVFELEQMPIGCATPPMGLVTQCFEELRWRLRQLLHPNSPSQWFPRGPLFYITNEFNFATGTNAAEGKETGR